MVVHGGAWAIPEELTERSLKGVQRAAKEGHRVLSSGGSALDAVVAAVTVLEDDTAFDAGHGAVLNKKGEVELDAIVINGSDLSSGAVCAVQDIANPVQLARLVMEKTDHCLLAGQGANEFATEQDIARLPSEQLVTSEARVEWEKYVKYSTTVNALFSAREEVPQSKCPGCDTVGAVAMDTSGNIASATSTGGITAKRPGRVGDTPIIGAGAYADNNTGGVSTTGHGESIMKVGLARRIGELMDKGLSADDASKQALDFMSARVGGAGGVIVISKQGEVTHHFTTSRMAWAQAVGGKLQSGIDPNKVFTQPLSE